MKSTEYTFSVFERDVDARSRVMVVIPERAGCMTLMFDPRPEGEDPTVVVESVKHDSTCAEEGLPRKYGTRAMILGTMNVLVDVARSRYPHLKEFEPERDST